MANSLSPTPQVHPTLSDLPGLCHPASRHTLLSLQIWERCYYQEQLTFRRQVKAPPLPELPEIVKGNAGHRAAESQARALAWELECKASRFPKEVEEVEYRYVPIQGWGPLQLPGKTSPRDKADPMLILCSTATLPEFWIACRDTLQLAPIQIRSHDGKPTFLLCDGPILTLANFDFRLLASYPTDHHPIFPIQLKAGASPFAREATKSINEAYTCTTAALGAQIIWAPILPRMEFV